jgi:phospholipid-binding lipoprotein MlaA
VRLLICSHRGRIVSAVGFVAALVALGGCGTVSPGLRAASVVSDDGEGARVSAMATQALADVRAGERAPAVPADASTEAVTTDAPAVADSDRVAASAVAEPGNDTMAVEAAAPVAVAPVLVAQGKGSSDDDEYDIEDYDPWEPFNEKMFDFNYKLDKYLLKPVAKAYDRVMPDDVQRMISNAFDNLGAIKRMVNSALQGKWDGSVRELSRFMLNTTVGVGGLFDMAKAAEIPKSNEDFGQTLGVYGVGPGPYLVLPFLEPMTVRDGIGRGVDSLFDPLGYFISLGIVERIALKVTEVVNDRSLNLELFQGFEETVVDLYSAVRHAYLERRRSLIKQ